MAGGPRRGMGGSVGQGNGADSNHVPEGLDEEVFGVDGHHQDDDEDLMSYAYTMQAFRRPDCRGKGESAGELTGPGVAERGRDERQRREECGRHGARTNPVSGHTQKGG